MAGFNVKRQIGGLDKVQAQLKGVKAGLRNKVMRPAMTKATRIVAKEVKKVTPVGPTGLLKKSIGAKVVTSRGRLLGMVGARKGFRRVVDGTPVDPTKYLHLVELGRKAVAAKKARLLAGRGRVWGRKVKAAAPRRILARGFDQARGAAFAAFAAEAQARIARLVKP